MVSKGQFVGLDWNRITRLHSQAMTGTQEVKNSLTASRCHLKAYPRCGQPTSKVSILKMKQQQHDILISVVYWYVRTQFNFGRVHYLFI